MISKRISRVWPWSVQTLSRGVMFKPWVGHWFSLPPGLQSAGKPYLILPLGLNLNRFEGFSNLN